MNTLTFQDHPVKIIDHFECGGIELAVIQVIDGSRPFVDGVRFPTRTAYKTLPLQTLYELNSIDGTSLIQGEVFSLDATNLEVQDGRQ